MDPTLFDELPDTWYARWVRTTCDAALITPCQATLELRIFHDDPLARVPALQMTTQPRGLH